MTNDAYAVVPAAGRSVRMGRPKLLMPWRGATLIEHVLDAWKSSGVRRVVVVVHPDDEPLQSLCTNAGAEVVVPAEPPPEMRASVQCALQYIQDKYAPRREDAWLLAPADMPELAPSVIDSILAEHRPAAPQILAPTHRGKRGHPVLFPWPFAAQVPQLGSDQGINALVASNPVRTVECGDAGILVDLDTPADVERWERRFGI